MSAIIRAFPVPPLRITRVQERALELIADGFHLLRVSEAIGVSCLEIRKWYDDKFFVEEIEKRIERRRLEARHAMEARAIDAVETLGMLLENESPDIQIRAAEVIIKHTDGLTPASRTDVNVTVAPKLSEAQLRVLEQIAAGGQSGTTAEIQDAEFAPSDRPDGAGDEPDAEAGDDGRDLGGDDGEGA